ncbi:MAG: nickel pincer cofactor biosynthesis protein LarB [Desulfobacterales bacterium]
MSQGSIQPEQAAERLSRLDFEDIRFAHVDHHRSLRRGFPEVVYGEGKTADQIGAILERMVPEEKVILVTRIDADKAAFLRSRFPQAVHFEDARMIRIGTPVPRNDILGKVLVISAGTSDIPVAREAVVTLEAMGHPVEGIFDVGVAGIHRLFAYRDRLLEASVLIVVAGMEGALPSVVGGLVDRPVIAVPTSVGYGVSFGGLTALFSMLNSCSSNVAVVNIDNGFGAGYMAAMMNRTR